MVVRSRADKKMGQDDTTVLTALDIWHNDSMSDQPPQSSSESSTSELRTPLDYRRIEIVEPQMAEIYRTKTVAEKLDLVQQAHRTARRLIAMGIRLQHPEFGECEVDREVARRLLRGAT